MEVTLKEIVELVRPSSPPLPGACLAPAPLGLCIVVADRGFVYVGQTSRLPNGEVFIDRAANVRRWGTTAGLPQLAGEGPQPNTKIDKGTQRVRIPATSIVHIIECKPEVWHGKLD